MVAEILHFEVGNLYRTYDDEIGQCSNNINIS
jgi:hypothetical protein